MNHKISLSHRDRSWVGGSSSNRSRTIVNAFLRLGLQEGVERMGEGGINE